MSGSTFQENNLVSGIWHQPKAIKFSDLKPSSVKAILDALNSNFSTETKDKKHGDEGLEKLRRKAKLYREKGFPRQAREQLELQARQRLELQARQEPGLVSQQLELQARQEPGLVSQQLELQARQELELARQQLELQAKQQKELQAKQQKELQAKQQKELQAKQQLELQAKQQEELKAKEEMELKKLNSELALWTQKFLTWLRDYKGSDKNSIHASMNEYLDEVKGYIEKQKFSVSQSLRCRIRACEEIFNKIIMPKSETSIESSSSSSSSSREALRERNQNLPNEGDAVMTPRSLGF